MHSLLNGNNQPGPIKALISQFLKVPPARFASLALPAMLAITVSGQTLITLHNFPSSLHDGQAPGSGVIIDQNGHLFGSTGIGGEHSDGTVFELSPAAAGSMAFLETILHSFQGMPDGKNPISRLVMSSNGILYGTAAHGGANDQGIAYAVTPGVGNGRATETIIHNFGATPDDVVSPDLGFFIAPEGLYGVDNGGANLTGAFYLLTPPVSGTMWTQHILYSFKPSQSGDAASPSGELVRDSSGNFYGVSVQGGVNNLGAIYELSPPKTQGGAWTETVLFSFNGTNGTLAAGKLLLGARGQLYGTAGSGGASGSGVVFELAPPDVPGGTWKYTIVYSFTGGADGGSPENGVISDGKGNLLGTAGNIFMLTPAAGGWKESVLHTFTGPDGFAPITPLTLANNSVYGTTVLAGAFGSGTVFQLILP